MRFLKLLLGLMSVLVFDDFNRANANPIGTPYATITSEGAMAIVSNKATFASDVDSGCRHSTITWPADQYSKAKLATTSTTGGGAGPCLHVRVAAAAQTYYRLAVDHAASNNVIVHRVVTGTFTALTGFPLTQAWTDGDTWELRVVGSLVSVYRNSGLIASATDTNVTSGSPGFGYSSVAGSPTIDDWEGGTTDAPLLAVVDKPLTLIRCRPLGPGNPLREVKYYNGGTAAPTTVEIIPDVGSLVLDGFAPTFPFSLNPGSGDLTLSGFTPTFPTLVVPGSGQLTLTGFGPALGLPKTLVPGFGQLALTGNAPTFPTLVTPGSGALSLSGFSPTLGLPKTIVPGFGQLTLTGLSPTFPRSILPGSGTLTLSGFSPTIGVPYTLRPGLGALVLDGFAGTFGSGGGVNLTLGFGQLTLNGFSPTLGRPITVRPDLGTLSLTGQSPSIGVPVTVRPDLGQLTLAGQAPSISFTPPGFFLLPGTGSLSLSGYAPMIGTFTFRIEGGPVMQATITAGGVLIATLSGGPTFSGGMSGGPL